MVLPQEQRSSIRRSSQRMLIGRLQIVEGLRELPDLVAKEVLILSEAQLRWRPAEAEWSIKEVCAHLHDAAQVGDMRLSMMLTQTIPRLPALDPGWVRERNAQDEDIAAVLKAYRTVRSRTIEQIENLPDANWARTGHHPSAGHMSIRQLTERMLNHERDHLQQIKTLKMHLPER